MNNYEEVLIFKPDVDEEGRQKILETLKGVLEAEGGEVVSVDEWGLRKLAYEINYIKEGYYYIINFKANPDLISELERRMRLSESVLRYMTVRQDD